MSKTVTGIFENRISAEYVVDELTANGIPTNDISLLMSENTRGKEFQIESGSKAKEGVGIGGVTGGALGALAAGLTAAATISTGGGALLVAGPIAAALAGAGAGGAAGGIVGGLIGLGVPEHEAKLAKEELEKGHMLLAVSVEKDRVDFVKGLLKDRGGEKVKTQ